MPYKPHGPEKLEAIVNCRLTRDEKANLVQQAADAGISLSELVRRRALGRRVDAATDRNAIQELRRLGGLLKQVYAAGGDPAQTGATLQAIRTAIDRLAK